MRKRRQLAFLEPGQAPALAAVSVGPAGHQQAAKGEGDAEVDDGVLDLVPALPCLGHFVQAIQEHEAALFSQFPFKRRRELASAARGKLALDEVQQVLRPRLLTSSRQSARRKVAQHDPHRQDRAVAPALRGALPAVFVRVFVGQRSSQGLDPDGLLPQPLGRQAQGHESHEGTLAAARIAQQNQPIDQVQRGQRGNVFLGRTGQQGPLLLRRLASFQVLLLRSQRAQSGVDRIQAKRRVRLGPVRRLGIHPLQRQPPRGFENIVEVRLAQSWR